MIGDPYLMDEVIDFISGTANHLDIIESCKLETACNDSAKKVITTSTGIGDVVYPVFVRVVDMGAAGGRVVAEVRLTFRLNPALCKPIKE